MTQCPRPPIAGLKVSDGVRFANQLSHMMGALLASTVSSEVVRRRRG